MPLNGHSLYLKRTVHLYRIYEKCVPIREIAVLATLTDLYIEEDDHIRKHSVSSLENGFRES
jgi:hypothetical protein